MNIRDYEFMSKCNKEDIVDGVIRTIQKIRSDVAEPTERLGYPDYIVEDQVNRLLPEFSTTNKDFNLLELALSINTKSDVEVLNFLIICWRYDRLIKLFPLFNRSETLPTVDQFLNMMKV